MSRETNHVLQMLIALVLITVGAGLALGWPPALLILGVALYFDAQGDRLER